MTPRATALSAIPSVLIGPLRDVLATQGIDRAAVNDAGDIDTSALVKSLITDVEVRTEFTRPFNLSIAKTLDGPANPLWAQLKPTVIINGPRIGRVVVAPYGEASPEGSDSALWTLGLGVAGMFGIGVLIGGLMNRRR